ncbi:MAG: hypothetical protein F4185_00320 [Chloroflexi bacterium]|nr:hypothetical protein [Chloroflexota bacterium]MYF64478.1 hypothetical protein [Chloroflexota bacterium]MYK33572.1 hypothetical protein [Chloroflexota bacterium]
MVRSKVILGGTAAVVVVLGLAIFLVLNVVAPASFCDIALILDAAMDAGEDIYRAMEDFYSKVTDSMLAALPDDIRRPAEVLVQIVDGLLSGPRMLASLIFDRLDPAVDAVAVACRVAG